MKIKDSAARLVCHHCGGRHLGSECPRRPISKAPLEVPSHNGAYRGTLPVRTIPPATEGEDLKPYRKWQGKASLGHLVQSRLALANRRPRDKDGKFLKPVAKKAKRR